MAENPTFNICDSLLLYIVIFSCGIFFHKNLLTAKVLWTVVALLILALGEVTVFMFLKLLNIETSSILQNQQLYTAVAITTKICAFLIVEFIRWLKPKNLILPRYAHSEMCGIIGINLFLIIFSVQIFQSDTKAINKDTLLSLLFLLCFIISILTFSIIFKLSRKAEEELEEKLLIQKLEMENKMNADMTNVVENLRSLRHDMNNHIGVMNGLVHAKQYDALEEYIHEIYHDISPANEFIFTHNKALSALLYNKMLNTKLKGIEFDPVIRITNCNIATKDICSLLGNLLDNAIEAAEKAEDHKYIELVMSKKNNCYIIQCNNTFRDIPIKINDNFITSKKSKDFHGIGIKNIKSIVNKYSGSLLISYTDLFRVEIILPVKPITN
ncbi:MAG: GHKL domain-containing protein [Lachnospiraceae bacterium]|nr:GHKL domain-containing protein [Lachnospiraceae bacterium]